MLFPAVPGDFDVLTTSCLRCELRAWGRVGLQNSAIALAGHHELGPLLRLDGTMKVEGIAQDPLTNRVIRSVQNLIWRGEIMPGESLPPQQKLAEQYGVGLSTIREAVKALSMIGLLEARPGRGTRVLPDALRILN